MFKKGLIRWLISMAIVCLIATNLTFIAYADVAQADEEPLIHYVIKGENGLIGHIFTNKNGYYIRATLFFDDSYYSIIIVPVDKNGVWELLIRGNIEHASLQVVDRPNAFVPGEFVVYDSIGINFLE